MLPYTSLGKSGFKLAEASSVFHMSRKLAELAITWHDMERAEARGSRQY